MRPASFFVSLLTSRRYPLHWAAPGGHAEPSDIGVSDSLENVSEDAIRDELFDASQKEVVEETGISKSELSGPLLLGISRRVHHHRPVAIFVQRTTLSAEEVLAHYTPEAAVDHDESIDIRLLPVSSVPSLTEHFAMPGCQQGGAELFRRYLRTTGEL